MGNLIDKLKKDKPAFLVEFNDFVQKIRLENNDELVNLHSTISSEGSIRKSTISKKPRNSRCNISNS